jgi:hypothetical protein
VARNNLQVEEGLRFVTSLIDCKVLYCLDEVYFVQGVCGGNIKSSEKASSATLHVIP